ncbi:diguanylate cyclase [Meiothermus hypogaeus]|uniref:Diguanylate cyclase n=2 Tax=Meiothermus hypogaeus TaxID=884155 RepID=A0A511QYR1_9DEIN|nr:diguanylate cyclase [Meiothermus hypogaeus]RIH80999.1 putative diguanylate cyclase AdrA [Meiothermus hypogaeus]GEM82505.1 diguanylate cyclase [Meiothermus hypogaeus NBRC 106114]
MTIPYPAILVASLAAAAAVYGLGLAGIYALPWFMFFSATAASVHGLWVGTVAALGSVVLLNFYPSNPQDYLVMAFILLLSAYLADQVGHSLRRAHRRAKQLAQIQDVFLQGLELVPRFLSREQLLRELPGMFSQLLRGSQLRIWIPRGAQQLELLQTDPLNTGDLPTPLVRQALGVRQLVWPDMDLARRSPKKPGHPAPGRVGTPGPYELAVALRVRDEPVAVLQFLRGEAWRQEELELFFRLAQTVSRQLEHLQDLELRRLLLKVADQLSAASNKQIVAEVALRHLLSALDMEAGAVMQYVKGTLRGIGWHLPKDLRPALTPLAQALANHQGIAWQAYHSGESHFFENYSAHPTALPELQQLGFETLVAYPVHIRDAMKGRVVLVLGKRAPVAWTRGKKEILLGVERLLSSALERALLEELHQRISRLLTEAWSVPSQQVYAHILEVAVELVPGSEAGSLWVWDGAAYRCRAWVGSGQACEETQDESSFMEWFGLEPAKALSGQPRIRSGQQTLRQGLQANLCLPVGHQGRVLAYLNLDNQHDPEAFAEDSLAVARLFAAPIATLIHELQNRSALEKAALTDGLTGLYNRRAFDLRLQEEFERARRYGYSLSLLVIDLKNFKPINDQLGHAVGDQALVAVARVLAQAQRLGDMVFRWGGDEFAVLLPQTDLEGARAAAGRLLEALSTICFEGFCLSANIGAASFPQEADSAQMLLNLADRRMYDDKKGVG